MTNGLADKPEKIDTALAVSAPQKPFFLSLDRASILPTDEVAAMLETDIDNGLVPLEVEARLQRFGPNELSKKVAVSPLRLFLAQFNSTVVILLLAAALASALGGEHLQAAGIVVAVLINAIVGFITEYKAQVSWQLWKNWPDR